MQHIPLDFNFDINPKLFAHTSLGALHMGVTAEFLAQTQGISRKEQDEFALRSHQRAAAAHAGGEFEREIVPVYGRDEEGNRTRVIVDQCVRFDASLDALAAFFSLVDAGNSWPNDWKPTSVHALRLDPT